MRSVLALHRSLAAQQNAPDPPKRTGGDARNGASSNWLKLDYSSESYESESSLDRLLLELRDPERDELRSSSESSE